MTIMIKLMIVFSVCPIRLTENRASRLLFNELSK
jgi:hypothetical protein